MQNNGSKHLSDLISVVIPCYNHGHYLSAAIESVVGQSYPFVEIVVIDDGSTDNTRQVAQRYEGVKYVYQTNSGLSAARNKGIEESKGAYLLFLDADDWLYPQALQINYQHLQQNPKAAFVSGSHDKFYEGEKRIESVQRQISTEHYKMFLSVGNYIGVPAAVLYRRWVFEEFRFDTALKACEDYHLYLNVARNYPVLHHDEKVAAYRQHEKNMSSNFNLMLHSALHVLGLQKPFLKTDSEKQALRKGKKFWKSYYVNQLYKKLKSGNIKATGQNIKTVLIHKPQYLLRFIKDVITNKFEFNTS
mgnify:CR=1 FL=1